MLNLFGKYSLFKIKKDQTGFTFIEVMIAIAIVKNEEYLQGLTSDPIEYIGTGGDGDRSCSRRFTREYSWN